MPLNVFQAVVTIRIVCNHNSQHMIHNQKGDKLCTLAQHMQGH